MKNKRLLIFCDTVMTLLSSIYYAGEIRKCQGDNIEAVLIWRNCTSYNIPVYKLGKEVFDKIVDIPSSIGWSGPLSFRYLNEYFICLSYLRKSGLISLIKDGYSNEVLMISGDYNTLPKIIMDVFYKKKNLHKCILFEEGMSTYSAYKHTVRNLIRYNLGKSANLQPSIGFSNKINTVFVKAPEIFPEVKKRNKVVIKQSDIFSDNKMWEEILLKDSRIKELMVLSKNKKIYLYLGQPIHEFDSEFSMDQEIKLIEEILAKVPTNAILLVKPHPRDNRNKYNKLKNLLNCYIFDRNINWYPVECMASLFDIKQVISFASTGALNLLDTLTECIAIYTYKVFNIKIDHNWEILMDNYKDRVYIPVNKEEILSEVVKAQKYCSEQVIQSKYKKDIIYLTKWFQKS